jgi:hypothetical protein
MKIFRVCPLKTGPYPPSARSLTMTTYSVVHGQHTAMAAKEGWYVKETDGMTRVIDRRYETWLEAKASANRLTELEATSP